MPATDLRLLSLMILRQLMAAVDPDAPPKPCDYFDMIGGTTGVAAWSGREGQSTCPEPVISPAA